MAFQRVVGIASAVGGGERLRKGSATVGPAALREALALGAAALGGSSATPRLDAELLLAKALGASRERLLFLTAGVGAEPVDLPPDLLSRYWQLLLRRQAGEPVAYIVGSRSFRRLDLAVDPRVLVPRPESELLVEIGLSLPQGARVVDVGTGSGAIALALKEERPDLEVVGTDKSLSALAVAWENAARLGLAVQFCQTDLLASVPPPDAVLCNPPYLPEGVQTPPELSYEPPEALFAGPDGLAVIRRLCGQLAALPEVKVAAIEFGSGQERAVCRLLEGAGFTRTEVHRDLAGLPRVAVGRRDG
jgi:release factor glutamine methyltransferase